MISVREYGFTNYIEIEGKEVLMTSLSEEERKKAAYAMQDKVAAVIRMRRKAKTA